MFGHSIAVLPFINLNGQSEYDYFSDGVSEAIMTELAKIPALRVTSRTSAFAFKNQQKDIREIGSLLGVSFIIEGSVLKTETHLRISFQLVDARSGFQLFSEAINDRIDRYFELLDALSRKIGAQLANSISIDSPLRPTNNIEAYNLYLKGNHHFNKFTPDHFKKAVKAYQEAIRLDPDFALAYTGLAMVYFIQGNQGQVKSSINYPKVKIAVEKAIELDPDLPEAHVLLAMIKMYFDLNWRSAGRSFARALEIGREIPFIYRHYAWYLVGLKRFDEAIDLMHVALKYDPISPLLYCTLGDIYRYKRNAEKAMEQFQRVLDLDPNFRYAKEMQGYIQVEEGNYTKAIQLYKDYKEAVRNPLAGCTGLCYAYAKAGNFEQATFYLNNIFQLKKEEPNRNLTGDLFAAYIGFGEKEKALIHLEKLFEDRMAIIAILVEPIMEPIRGTNEYKRLLSQFILEDGVGTEINPIEAPQGDKIKIQAEVNDFIQIHPNQFLYAEAQDNYARIFWEEENLMKNKLMRISIKRLEEQLHSSEILRCHRSYLVNLNHRFTVHGNARGYRLQSFLFDFEVPVSRSLSDKVLTLMGKETR